MTARTMGPYFTDFIRIGFSFWFINYWIGSPVESCSYGLAKPASLDHIE
jgi:hypothetical protein